MEDKSISANEINHRIDDIESSQAEMAELLSGAYERIEVLEKLLEAHVQDALAANQVRGCTVAADLRAPSERHEQRPAGH